MGIRFVHSHRSCVCVPYHVNKQFLIPSSLPHTRHYHHHHHLFLFAFPLISNSSSFSFLSRHPKSARPSLPFSLPTLSSAPSPPSPPTRSVILIAASCPPLSTRAHLWVCLQYPKDERIYILAAGGQGVCRPMRRARFGGSLRLPL